MSAKGLLVFCLAMLFLAGCKDDPKVAQKKAEDEKIIIYTSIQPIAFIASKIAGRYADVRALIPKGKSPHSYTLLPSDLSEMSKARFFFSIRLPFEEFKLEKAFKNSKTKWVDISKGVQFQRIEGDDDHNHEHGHDHDAHKDASELMDPHIWLNPENDLILARNICDTLRKAMPEHSDYFELNFKNFVIVLISLDKKLKKMLKPFKGEIFLVYHPAFGYFAKRYGLRQEAIELGGKSPTAKHLHTVIALAKKKKVRIVFVQPEFNRKAAKLIADAINGSVIKLNPLAYNLIDNYMMFASEIQSAMKREGLKSKRNEKK
jgi:zinc transport system substrate-binding protein